MAAWIRYSHKRFAYAGRIARAPFSAWTATAEGGAAVDQLAATIRFALFGKTRAARRRLWLQLAAAAREEAVVSAIQTEVQLYLTRLGQLAYCDGLPRDTVGLRRLVVVPNVLLNGDAYGAIDTRLVAQPAFADLECSEALRQFFIVTLIADLDAAAKRASPSPRHPLAAGPGWISVGATSGFDWRVPMMNEPAWGGHHYVLELTSKPITRALRKAVAASVTRMEASLATLSRIERNERLRRARYAA
jgi:hypothetical protein